MTNQDLKSQWVRQLLAGMVIEVDREGSGGVIYVDRPYAGEEHYVYATLKGDWAGVVEPICEVGSDFILDFLNRFTSIRATEDRVAASTRLT